MACCMLLALIAGNIVLMWRRIRAWWSPAAAAEVAADAAAAAWRPGMETSPVPPSALLARRKWRAGLIKPFGIALIVISLSYFGIQAKAAFDTAGDGRSFALLLMQNICRSTPTGETPAQIASLAARPGITQKP